MHIKNTGFGLLLAGLLAFAGGIHLAQGQGITVNYDEAKVGTYTLPDPLRLPDGTAVTTARQWEQQARPDVLNLFKEHVYGQMPAKPAGLRFKIRNENKNALNGLATRKQVTIYFTPAADAPSMEVLLYIPNKVQGPVPAFVGLNFYGNQSIHPDKGILLPTRWVNNNPKGVVNNKATEASRGLQASRWPVEELMKQGFALVTAYYGDLEPDHVDGWKTGIRTTLNDELKIKEDEWGAIGAWAWGLSRIMDYLEKDKSINAGQVALTGHSRIGKAALWAAANDNRFALVISNDSGEGGAALARRNYGETIAQINRSFPHWFNPTYKNYNQAPEKMPVDQHMLLALMAPRPLYVNSALEDQWADPRGEFLSALQAEPVYQLYQKKGLGVTEMPPVEKPVGETIGYHIRNGKHDINAYDWQQHIAFAQKHFKKKAKPKS
ncbi:glucuronyl esterase domain-containing protein [Adhaeribacter rhizoryzae]|uniref:Acetylxylan esterase n=1 Tax=Adhaeribacter rhizoryzae TaxID=2607907 RepID=A0A5M6DSN0_9BACT|nr:acetylxylan esterase [Adhaeribacter rhizoryzae]KAA5548425.1 acetylxylan esterase [Adhaeribacter rhizoryzae]